MIITMFEVARQCSPRVSALACALAAVVAAATRVALEEPEQARMSLEAIQATSVKSLTELRTMLDGLPPRGALASGRGAGGAGGRPPAGHPRHSSAEVS